MAPKRFLRWHQYFHWLKRHKSLNGWLIIEQRASRRHNQIVKFDDQLIGCCIKTINLGTLGKSSRCCSIAYEYWFSQEINSWHGYCSRRNDWLTHFSFGVYNCIYDNDDFCSKEYSCWYKRWFWIKFSQKLLNQGLISSLK